MSAAGAGSRGAPGGERGHGRSGIGWSLAGDLADEPVYVLEFGEAAEECLPVLVGEQVG
jgi:hypothetical protein